MSSFDERAATWDENPGTAERSRLVAETILDAVSLDGTQRLLEYGAGTGLVTQELRAHVGPVTLVDNSSGMRDVMREKIAAGVIADARVWEVDLETDPVPDERFDLIVTVLTMHHVHDVPTVLSGFAELLDDGGRLCIVDLDEEDGSFHGPDADVHHGFGRAELAGWLTDAGFTDIEFRDCHTVVREHGPFPMFLATCTVAPR